MKLSYVKNLSRFELFVRIFLSIVLALLIATVISVNKSRRNIVTSVEASLSKDVDLLYKMFELENKLKKDEVITGSNVVHAIFYSKPLTISANGDSVFIEDQFTENKHKAFLHYWYWDKHLINNSSFLVDSIQKILRGGTVTIFQKSDSGYVRISTNVRRSDKIRAINTYIPNNSPVIRTIEKGQRYIGRAFVVNQWYITAYEPIFYKEKIVGMLYFGDKEKNLKELAQIIKSIKLGRSGHVVVIDTAGKCIIPCNEKFNLPTQLLNNEGILHYKTNGGKYIAAYKFFNGFKFYIVAIVKERVETHQEIMNIVKSSLLVGALITVILSLFIYRFTNIEIESKDKAIWETKIALLESEMRFKTLFENTGDDIFVLDKNGRIIEVNRTICNTLGYSKEDLLQMTVYQIVPSQKTTEIKHYLERIFKQGKLIYDCELLTKKGETLQVEIKSRLITIDKKEYILSIARNVSERKKFLNQILNAVIQTEERERERFAKEMHDGIGPLFSAVKLYVNELDDASIEDEDRKEIIEQINQLIDEAISSIRAISNNLMPQIIIDYGLEKAVRLYCNKITKTEKINIHFNATNIDKTLPLDHQLILYRVILELITNTLKHAKAKNIFIDLTRKDSKLELFFVDDGIGFDSEKIMCEKNKGMGLKNIISRIRSINGNYKLVSAPGKGFKLFIEIPL